MQQEDRLRANGAEDYPEVPATPPRRRTDSHSTLERKKTLNTLNSELTDQRLEIRVCETESSEAVRSVSHMHMQMCVVGTLFALYVLPLVITVMYNPVLSYPLASDLATS